jgi:hypothetical protein
MIFCKSRHVFTLQSALTVSDSKENRLCKDKLVEQNTLIREATQGIKHPVESPRTHIAYYYHKFSIG